MFSEDLRRFIRSSVRSIWALELLLLLRRRADKAWTVDALTGELRSRDKLVAEILAEFVQRGLVAAENSNTFRYKPASDVLDNLVSELENAYSERRIALIQEIVAAPNEKIQTLADAFRLKRE